MEPVEALKSGLHTAYWRIFFIISLHPDDCKGFVKQYHWKVLPKGMANCLTLCGKNYLCFNTRSQDFEFFSAYYSWSFITGFCSYTMGFKIFGVVVVPEKIQVQYLLQYLGYQLYPRQTVAQKIQIRKDNLLKVIFIVFRRC